MGTCEYTLMNAVWHDCYFPRVQKYGPIRDYIAEHYTPACMIAFRRVWGDYTEHLHLSTRKENNQ